MVVLQATIVFRAEPRYRIKIKAPMHMLFL